MTDRQDLSAAARRAHDRAAELRAQSEAVLAAADETIARARAGYDSGRLAQLVNEVQGLRRAMESRAVIEQAKGVLVALTGCDPDVAFERLVQQSQHENRKLREVAEELVRSKIRYSPN